MKYAEFKNEIENIYSKYFPESICNVKIFHCMGQAITIDCYMAGDKTEFPYGYAVNDMLSISFMAFLPNHFTKEDDLPENLTYTAQSHSYKVKSESKYLAYDRKSVSYRKTTGSEKFVKAFEKFVKRLHDSIIDDMTAGNVHAEYKELVERKVK